MGTREAISGLLLALLWSGALLAGGLAEWEGYCKDPKGFAELRKGRFVLRCPKVFIAPGPKPPTGEEKVDEFAGELATMTTEKFEKIKEAALRFEKERAAAEKRVAELKAEFDEEGLVYAEKRLQENTRLAEEYKIRVRRTEEWIAEKKQEAENARKGLRKPKPKVTETHEAQVADYFKLARALDGAERDINQADALIGGYETNIWQDGQVRIFLTTERKDWEALKSRPPLVDMAPVVSVDARNRALWVLATPSSTNQLGKAISYAALELYLEEGLKMLGGTADLADTLRIGFCADLSGLDRLLLPGRVVNPPYIPDDKLLLPSELFNMVSLENLEKRVYFLRQSAAMAAVLRQSGSEAYGTFLRKYNGGNSGIRHSFENLVVHATWGQEFDDFCNCLPERGFFPLTKTAITNPAALQEWQEKWKVADENYNKAQDAKSDRRSGHTTIRHHRYH